jgi:hypothetical protein
VADVGRSAALGDLGASIIFGLSIYDLLMGGSLAAGLLVADGFVGVSLGVSLEDLLVAGSLKAPFVSRALVTRLYINCELRFFYQSASSVACALHLLVGSFCWSNSTRPAEVFKFNTNKKRRSFILTYSNMIVSDHYNLSMYIMVVYDET